MLFGDFGTSWTKLYDSDSDEYDIVPAVKTRDMKVDAATGHNGKLHSSCVVGELSAMISGGLNIIGNDFLILDIGSRDMKFVEVIDGRVSRMEWNTQCGAMTGFTLEIVGRYFDLNFGEIEPSEKGYPMTCGVLGLEKAFDEMAAGVDHKKAVARLAHGIAAAALRFMGSPESFYLSGGMCDNPLFIASLPEEVEVTPLGRFVLVEGLRADAGV